MSVHTKQKADFENDKGIINLNKIIRKIPTDTNEYIDMESDKNNNNINPIILVYEKERKKINKNE